ncbi:MAG: DUF3828 domain-containing protein [Bacteroidaceae bacterium]|nr:DUF3828 domain-containing protein [Bacteroidaceae bacterium]
MKKTLIALVAATAISFTSCGNKTNGSDQGNDSIFMLDGPGSEYNPTEHDLKMNTLAVQKKAVKKKVEEIYEAVNKAYSNTGEYGTDTDLDEMFCSDDWREKVKAVRIKDMPIDGMGFFDADYWVMGQDYDMGNISVSNIKITDIELDEEPWRATVDCTLHNFSPIPISIEFVHEENTWKVDDLIDLKAGLDWKRAMIAYLNE